MWLRDLRRASALSGSLEISRTQQWAWSARCALQAGHISMPCACKQTTNIQCLRLAVEAACHGYLQHSSACCMEGRHTVYVLSMWTAMVQRRHRMPCICACKSVFSRCHGRVNTSRHGDGQQGQHGVDDTSHETLEGSQCWSCMILWPESQAVYIQAQVLCVRKGPWNVRYMPISARHTKTLCVFCY